MITFRSLGALALLIAATSAAAGCAGATTAPSPTATSPTADRPATAAASQRNLSQEATAEAYYNDYGTYAGMTVAVLKAGYDSGIAPGLAIYGTPSTSYCLTDTQNSHSWSVRGPGPSISSYVANGTCS